MELAPCVSSFLMSIILFYHIIALLPSQKAKTGTGAASMTVPTPALVQICTLRYFVLKSTKKPLLAVKTKEASFIPKNNRKHTFYLFKKPAHSFEYSSKCAFQ